MFIESGCWGCTAHSSGSYPRGFWPQRLLSPRGESAATVRSLQLFRCALKTSAENCFLHRFRHVAFTPVERRKDRRVNSPKKEGATRTLFTDRTRESRSKIRKITLSYSKRLRPGEPRFQRKRFKVSQPENAPPSRAENITQSGRHDSTFVGNDVNSNHVKKREVLSPRGLSQEAELNVWV